MFKTYFNRATAAASHDQYHLIRDFYTNLTGHGIDVDRYEGGDDVTIDDIFTSNRHMIQDMLVR